MTSGLTQILEPAVAAHQAGRLDEAEALYRAALAVEADAEAFHLLGLVRFQKGDPAGGAGLIRRALALTPAAAAFLENLAVISWSSGGTGRALVSARRGLAVAPSAGLLGIAGQALIASGDLGRALETFIALAALGSESAKLDVAFCLRKLGRRVEAESLYREIAAAGVDARPRAALAEMTAEMARQGEAIALWRSALALAPDDPTLFFGLGNSLFGSDLSISSITAFGRALALSVQGGNEGLAASALMGMAGARQKNREGRVAKACMRRALALVPEDAAGWRNASDLVRKEDEGERSLGFARRALAIDRNDPTAHSNLGLAAAAIGDLSGAGAAFHRAISLDPADPRHYCNLADPLHLTGRFDAMRVVLRRALALAPDFAAAAYMLGVTGMLTGELESAWRHYEHRFSPPAVIKARPFPQPWWDGGALSGRLLVWGEQGVGDEIVFGSILPDLKERGLAAVLEIDPRLVPVFARSFPSFEVVGRSDPPDRRLLAPEVVAQIAMGSLPRLFRPTLASFSKGRGFLIPDARRCAEARAWLEALGPGLKVGIAWRSSRRDVVARRLHTELSEWSPILKTAGVHFVNLQYGDCEEELSAAEIRSGVRIHRAPGLDLFADLEGVFGLSACLDLVISTITTAHMPGAASGTETWLLLPRIDSWAIAQDRYPWFPTTRGFVREVGESWDHVIGAVAEALARRRADHMGGWEGRGDAD